MITLRPYQEDLSCRIDKSWQDGASNVCAVLPCGGGKTILFGTKLATTSGVRFAVAHRQELVSQMSMTIAKMGVDHCIIAPDSLLKNIIKMQIREYGRHFYNPRSTCIVTGVMTLINRAARLPVDRTALWIIDECFPAGTLIDRKPIEQYKIGDLVWSFNESKGIFEKQKIVRLFKKPMPDKMITINNQITCTLNHPFYTQRGWVEAGELKTNDLLLHRMWERNKRKNGKNTAKYRSFPETTRRERLPANASRKNINEHVRGNGFCVRMCRQDRSLQRRFRVSDMLQNRNRGGWWQSFFNRKTRARLEKRQIFGWERVENIQIYESGNHERPVENYVYNIEVYGNHTYVANNYVVHNCHHCLRSNVWGKVAELFPKSARGLGVTATPNRADGRGIGRTADGIFDVMVEGPSMRWFIQNNYLTDYRIFGPYSHMDLSTVAISAATGDYNRPQLVAAAHKSQIVGDVVKSYLEFAPGKLGVVFVTDVETGEKVTKAYQEACVPAACVHAKTPDAERHNAIRALKEGNIKLLVNVDIFGEGFDLPAIEVVIMARPTESLPLYIQQFGRGLRTMPGKDKAIIIDHVRNIEQHRLPDSPRDWNLDSRDRKASKRNPDLIPIRTCRNCVAIYESWNKDCPYCGWQYVPMPMRTIEQVEGVISELDPTILAAMRKEVDRIDGPPPLVPGAAQHGVNAQWRRRQEAQAALREAIALWAGYQRAAWQEDDVIMRRFYATYGIDVVSAQVLGRREAEELTIKLTEAIR